LFWAELKHGYGIFFFATDEGRHLQDEPVTPLTLQL